jgi:pyridoxine/pyridoxamine 5'-phosphate oxidase
MAQNNEALKQKVRDFLNSHRKAVFSILDEEGLPTTTLMLYAMDDDMNILFGTRKGFAKYANIHKKPVVSLSVIEEEIDPRKVVDVRGDVEEIPEAELKDAHAYFKSKNPSDLYVDREHDFTMFRLKPHFVRWLDAESGELQTVDLSL